MSNRNKEALLLNHGTATFKNGIVTHADDAFCKIFNVPLKHVLGMDLSALYRTPQGLEDFLSKLQQAFQTQNDAFISTSWCMNDGQVADIMLHATLSSGRETDEWIFRVCDTTDLHKTIRLKRVDEKTLQTIFDHSPIGFGLLLLDPSGNRTMGWYNLAMGKIFGYENGSLLGKSTRILYKNDEEFFKTGKLMKSQIKKHGGSDFIRPMVHRDGSEINGRIITVPILLGNEIQLLTMVEDISRQVQAEKKFKTLFESSMDAIHIIDRDLNSVDCNLSTLKLFGVDSKELFLALTMDDLSAVRQPDGELSREKAKRMLDIAIKENHNFFEWKHRKIDGQEFDSNVLLSKVEIDGNEMIQVTIRDISEQKKTQEMLTQSEKMMSVGGLAAGMAHEINNPLAGVLQNAAVMKNRLMDKTMPANIKAAESVGISMEKISEFVEARGILRMINAITDSGSIMASIVDNMLNFARKSDSTFSSHEPDALMEKVLIMASSDYNLKKKFDFKSIIIEKDYDKNLPMVACSGNEIQQVLLNILNNGAYAMFEKKRATEEYQPKFSLKLSTEKKSNMLYIAIKDNGPGIDEATCKRIFEPFFTTKPIGVGTGLGLSVSYFIITENHKGTLEVKSELGEGTSFIIHLPLQKSNV